MLLQLLKSRTVLFALFLAVLSIQVVTSGTGGNIFISGGEAT